MNLWELLERQAGLQPEMIAVREGSLTLTWEDFRRRAAALAAFLQDQGIQPGDRLSILEPNSHAQLEAAFAAAGLGVVLNPLNHRLAAGELEAILRDAGSRWMIADPALADRLELVAVPDSPVEGILWTGPPPAGFTCWRVADYEVEVSRSDREFRPVPTDAAALAQLYYTSGTTGRPKGVMLTHGNIGTHAVHAIAELQITDADVWGHFAPLFHLADAWAVFALTAAGGVHVLLPRFDPGAALEILEKEEVTLTNLVPTMLNLMVNHPTAPGRDYRKLRLLLTGGAPIAPSLVRRAMEVFGCDYAQTYGLTETSPYLTLSLLTEPLRRLPLEEQLHIKAKTGRPFRGVELKVVRADGAPVAPDGREVGEILARGPTVTPGYWNRPEETAEAFQDGWLRTGDLAVVDAQGYLDIVDRRKDVIITGGESVYSIEVENVLYQHPSVLEAAAFGRAHEVWGEIVTAAVVLMPGTRPTAEALIHFCRERLAAYKCPRVVEFLAELPKTGSGKISKRSLREGRPFPQP